MIKIKAKIEAAHTTMYQIGYKTSPKYKELKLYKVYSSKASKLGKKKRKFMKFTNMLKITTTIKNNQ